MTIYTTRYQAQQEIKNNPFCNSSMKIVKVCGGFAIMTADEYKLWKTQK